MRLWMNEPLPRAAELCGRGEAHAALPAGSPAPLYVIGTEVPVQAENRGLATCVTRTEDLKERST